MLPYPIYKRMHAPVFQGRNKKRNYFEGWYLKHVSDDHQLVFSLIPGIAFDPKGKSHSFIQLIDGQTAQTHYLEYPTADFEFDKYRFSGRIGTNRFGEEGIAVDLREKGIDFAADLSYSKLHKLKSTYARPGIMGWYGWIPVMECYHGLVSKFHYVSGEVNWNGESHSFNRGTGYIEKDWGKSFPSSWVWVQSNNFGTTETSFMLSIANIPWLGTHFTGFLCSFLFAGEIYVFATYTGANMRTKQLNGQELHIVLEDKQHRITLHASGAKAGILKAPSQGHMVREIAESIQGEIAVVFETRTGETLFTGTGTQAGIEIVGDVSGLLEGKFRGY
jgi:tocopherol cyclase